MPRAHRYYLPGHIWHITHRCHKREFLLKFARDRRRWEWWLFEARKRFSLAALNHIVTSNDLVVYGGADRMAIPRSMQLLAGRTAQEFNIRKKRKGASWEDRYHATAVESGAHLRRCMTYTNMNMVRAGAVEHPEEWECAGYHEIRKPPKRYARIDRERLASLLGLPKVDHLAGWQQESFADVFSSEARARCPEWTESLAVGGRDFVENVQTELGIDARHRSVEARNHDAHVRQEGTMKTYIHLFSASLGVLTGSIPKAKARI